MAIMNTKDDDAKKEVKIEENGVKLTDEQLEQVIGGVKFIEAEDDPIPGF